MTAATVSASTDAWILTTNNDLPILLATGLLKPGAALALTASTAGAALAAGSSTKYTGTAAATYTLAAPSLTALPITFLNTSKFNVTVSTTVPPTIIKPGQMVVFKPNAAGTAWVAS